MDLNLCIFASILLVSVGAIRLDVGPQRFTDATSPLSQINQNSGPNEVVLYLTNDQIKALEAAGAVVTPAEQENLSGSTELTNDDVNYNESEAPDYKDSNGFEYKEFDGPEYKESDGSDDSEPSNPDIEPSNETNEQPQEDGTEDEAKDIDLEEILRILNEDRAEENETPNKYAINEPRIIEENIQEVREINPRFLVRQKQSEDNVSGVIDKKARSRIYSAIRYPQRNEYPKKPRVQFSPPQIQEPIDSEEQNQEVPQGYISTAEKKFRLIPYEVVEKVEEPSQEEQEVEQTTQQVELEQLEPQGQSEEVEIPENDDLKNDALLSRLINSHRLTKEISEHKNRLFQSELELQAALRNFNQSPKYNDQKYAIEIEKLRTNLEKQNALAKAEAIAKAAPQVIKKEIEKRRPNSLNKQAKGAARNPEVQKPNIKTQKPAKVPVTRPVSVSYKKQKQPETPSTVEVEKNVPAAKNVYVKVDKPILVERVAPLEAKKEVSQNPVRKNERITILRHVWEH